MLKALVDSVHIYGKEVDLTKCNQRQLKKIQDICPHVIEEKKSVKNSNK